MSLLWFLVGFVPSMVITHIITKRVLKHREAVRRNGGHKLDCAWNDYERGDKCTCGRGKGLYE